MREKENSCIPDNALEALARLHRRVGCTASDQPWRLLPAIRSYFESEDGQHEFARQGDEARRRCQARWVNIKRGGRSDPAPLLC